jgi:AGZA family xanthine/uracil permease-like MFS transporter
MAMAYIIFANPAILQNGGVPFAGAVVATCVAAGVMCIFMGLLTNYPMCMAAGMGLNAVLAYTVCLGMKQPWQTAMGVVVLEGLAVLILSATTFRQAVLDAIPNSLKHAIAAGVGLFITFIGLQNGNIIKPHPATLVTYEEFNNPVTILAGIGLVVTFVLFALRLRGALLLGIAITAIVGMLPVWNLPPGFGSPASPVSDLAAARHGALIPLPHSLVALPRDWSTFFRADVAGAFSLKLLPVAFAFMMTDFFDTIGTAVAVGAKARYLDDRGRIPRIRRLLLVDSLGAIAGGACGCSSNTCYIESAAGAAEGGRTGLTAVVCGAMFLLALFFVPLVSVVGGGIQIAPGVIRNPVTAPALILVGFLMIESVQEIRWDNFVVALPAFLIIVLTPLTFSISHGIGAGFLAFVLLMALTRRLREIHPVMWIVALMFLAMFLLPAFSG